jgi:hypothetical protein
MRGFGVKVAAPGQEVVMANDQEQGRHKKVNVELRGHVVQCPIHEVHVRLIHLVVILAAVGEKGIALVRGGRVGCWVVCFLVESRAAMVEA